MSIRPEPVCAAPTRIEGLQHLIGNTPMLQLRFRFGGRERRLFAKAEYFNLTGSIKDRMAAHVLARAYERGEIRPGQPIAEATSGNTGIAFAAAGRALGHPVTIFMPNWMSREREDLIRSLGATIVPVSREQGGFLGSIRLSEEFAREHGAFLPRQFANDANAEAHELGTGPEILTQLAEVGVRPDAFVAGVGTGGTIMGVARCLRRHVPGVKLHPVEPAESPTLTTGHKVGRHRIQGISDEFIPEILKLGELDPVIAVHDGDAILMAQKLSRQFGLAVGISSGANFLAALLAQERLGPDAVVATVFCDDNKKYLSTDLMRDEPVRENYLAPQVELLGFTSVRRTGPTCRGAA
jgi:cysteine synthase A